jgi:hypothetical protein
MFHIAIGCSCSPAGRWGTSPDGRHRAVANHWSRFGQVHALILVFSSKPGIPLKNQKAARRSRRLYLSSPIRLSPRSRDIAIAGVQASPDLRRLWPGPVTRLSGQRRSRHVEQQAQRTLHIELESAAVSAFSGVMDGRVLIKNMIFRGRRGE